MKNTVRIFDHGLEVDIEDKGDYLVLDYTEMYEAPPLRFDDLKWLSEFYGTTDIRVDDINETGCETCDYGSRYGHEIYVKHPTRNRDVRCP